MTVSAKTPASPSATVQLIPFFTMLLIGLVFFYTGHDIFRARDFAGLSVEHFNPSDVDAEEMLAQYERGAAGKAAAYLLLGAFSAAVLALQLRAGRLRSNGLIAGLLIFFVAWSTLSLLWAAELAVTINKVVVFVILCVAALNAGLLFRPRDIIFLILGCSTAYLLVGVGTEIAFGAFRPWVAGYRFSGTIHPNGQGINCTFMFLSALFLGLYKKPDLRFLFLAALGLAFLALTKSRTPVGILFIALLFFWALRASLSTKVFVFSLAIVGLTSLVIFGDLLMPVATEVLRFGRTDVADVQGATFSGRVSLWRECLYYISQRPLLGYGYNAFWTVDNSFNVAAQVDWVSGSAHSIYLDVALGLGVVGLLAFASLLLLSLRILFVRYEQSKDLSEAFLWCVMLFAMLHGFMESAFIYPALYTFVCMLILAHLAFGRPGSDDAHSEEEDLASPQARRGLHQQGPPRSRKEAHG